MQFSGARQYIGYKSKHLLAALFFITSVEITLTNLGATSFNPVYGREDAESATKCDDLIVEPSYDGETDDTQTGSAEASSYDVAHQKTEIISHRLPDQPAEPRVSLNHSSLKSRAPPA